MKTYHSTRKQQISDELLRVSYDYPDQVRVILDELLDHLNDNQLDMIEDLIVNHYGEEEV